MNKMTSRRLTDLPDEILRSICFSLDWRDVLSLNATCRRFGNVANEHLLWKRFCYTVFRYWSASHGISAKSADPSFLDWKLLFQKRHEADSKTRLVLQDIISNQTARTPKLEDIISLGYDSKEVLLSNHARASQFDDHLARRYYILIKN